jgi:pimeloyl-ACP methyl ester carboxylesterase
MKLAQGALTLVLGLAFPAIPHTAPSTHTVILRGHAQQLHLSGDPTARPVIISSGDGGWIHLAPHVAEWMSTHGWSVTGFDAKAYLSGWTGGTRTLNVEDVARDYLMLVELAGESTRKPILVGVSEGAGLSVLAAADPRVRDRIAGVITFGLGDVNELAWRWRDSIIYLTKGTPREPGFHAADFLSRISPVPIALLWSAHDEFVPRDEQQRLVARARMPARAWTIRAADHRFSDNMLELEAELAHALEWIEQIRGGR